MGVLARVYYKKKERDVARKRREFYRIVTVKKRGGEVLKRASSTYLGDSSVFLS